ncbi:Abi family protein [Acidipropionibacterium timonense]|uniref:Abi family protein n=1 Tax=Acidipropionibacterium timonense TaxID=2161818 RepID=UPI00102F32CD|nr:Abi family protein [Acidipropionibacterium timonense]
MPRPLKSATTVDEQIALLRSRGMDVNDDLAGQWLTNVSYYRLSAYWYPARSFNFSGERGDVFAPGTSFTDVVALYEADRKLRMLVHDGMERVEVTLRTRLGEVLCHPDPLAYTDPSRFRASFDHAGWLRTARKRIGRAGKNNEAIKHYRYNYAGQYPFWVLAEVLDFADVSQLFEGLATKDQRVIAEGLGFVVNLSALSKNQRQKAKAQSPLVRWLEQLTIIRNICAHHGRLWNKSFTPAPTAALKTLPQFSQLPDGQSERIYGALSVMAQILRITSPCTTWPEKVRALITREFRENPLVTDSALGLPANPDL